MKRIILALTASVLVLTGCNSTKALTDKTAEKPSAFKPFSQQFQCDNGLSPLLHFPNDSQAQITLDGKTTTLNIATSASGARYVASSGLFGYGGEWHQKGDMAMFSYKGVHGVPAEISCNAQ